MGRIVCSRRVVRNAPTIGDALAAAARYFALQSTGAGLVLTTTGSEAHLVYTIFDPTVALHPRTPSSCSVCSFVRYATRWASPAGGHAR